MSKLYISLAMILTSCVIYTMEVGFQDEQAQQQHEQRQERAHAAQRQAHHHREELRKMQQQKKMIEKIGSLQGVREGSQYVAAHDYLAQNSSYATNIRLGINDGIKQGTGTAAAEIVREAIRDMKAFVSGDFLEKELEENLLKQKYADSIVGTITLNEAMKQLAVSYAETENGKNNPGLKALIDGNENQNIELLLEAYKKINSKPSTLQRCAQLAIPTAATFALGAIVMKIATASAA